jgi:hypothetical protein
MRVEQLPSGSAGADTLCTGATHPSKKIRKCGETAYDAAAEAEGMDAR